MAGFRKLRRYGFELVDAEHAKSVPQFRVNRKFTANHTNRIFRDFSAN
jgi:hypothetical protein